MSTTQRDGLSPQQTKAGGRKRWPFARIRCSLGGLVAGVLLAGWAAGGTERYGQEPGFVGQVRGTYRTFLKQFHFIAATGHDSFSEGSSSVRNLGLGQQIETRLCQDKGLDATGIVVDVEEDGTAVLRGLVSSSAHKDKAVTLVRDTRGVERVVDHLAVPPAARVINTPAGGSVPTGDATHSGTQK